MCREYWIPIDSNVGLSPTVGFELESIDAKVWTKTPFHNIYSCLWYINVTMATLGYGDITPVSTRGMSLAICACIIGTQHTLHLGDSRPKRGTHYHLYTITL